LGCTEKYIPGIGSNYYVLDADSIFFNDYNLIHDDIANNYMPGDSRDCANPPYFMLLDVLEIPVWKLTTTTCAGRGDARRCKEQQYCPIAHGMVCFDRYFQPHCVIIITYTHAYLNIFQFFFAKSTQIRHG
jgi:hypothetical protein